MPSTNAIPCHSDGIMSFLLIGKRNHPHLCLKCCRPHQTERKSVSSGANGHSVIMRRWLKKAWGPFSTS